MLEWYNKRYANFSGRATRSEYTTWLLLGFLIYIGGCFFGYLVKNNIVFYFLNYQVLGLLLLIPFSAVTVRRIRDLGFNGGWVFLNFIPYVNVILVLSLLIFKGEEKNNSYGENPYELEKV